MAWGLGHEDCYSLAFSIVFPPKREINNYICYAKYYIHKKALTFNLYVMLILYYNLCSLVYLFVFELSVFMFLKSDISCLTFLKICLCFPPLLLGLVHQHCWDEYNHQWCSLCHRLWEGQGGNNTFINISFCPSQVFVLHHRKNMYFRTIVNCEKYWCYMNSFIARFRFQKCLQW